MTKAGFLQALAEAVRGKRRTIYLPEHTGRGIRIVGDDGRWMCPITAVAAARVGGYWTVEMAWEAGHAIGLSFEDTKAIIAAADYGVYHELQIGLLVACGFHYRRRKDHEPLLIGEYAERDRLRELTRARS